tara:strand:+ start:762 stop:1283 length:522 start_codon:yes stop_codon:yes gene_type:complete
MLIILILLNTTSQKNKIQGGEEESAVDSLLENNNNNIDCTLEQVEKHNIEKDKWIYNNGNIYNLSPLIDTDINNADINIDTIIKFFKLSKKQDLSKIFKSIQSYNDTINEFNTENPDNQLDTFDFSDLDTSQTTETNSNTKQKNFLFDKFKFIFIKSITQFSKGIICPSGLKI